MYRLIEKHGNISTRRFYSTFDVSKSIDRVGKDFSNIAYNEYYNSYWFEEMFRVMYHSISNKLNSSGCKWICFNTWCPSIIDSDFKIEDDNYFLGSAGFISQLMRVENHLNYWSKDEHRQVCETLVKKLSGV